MGSQGTGTLDDYAACVGREVGVSDWIAIDQPRIDAFAAATQDFQFIHVDPGRAAETPFGSTIAHGFLTLALTSWMSSAALPNVKGVRMGINYGCNQLRFLAPVRSGKRVRGRFNLLSLERRKDGAAVVTYDVTVEIEGESRPALVAQWLALLVME